MLDLRRNDNYFFRLRKSDLKNQQLQRLLSLKYYCEFGPDKKTGE